MVQLRDTFFMKTKKNKNQKHIGEATPEVISLTWVAQEYPYHQKSLLWFIIAGIILVSLIIYGLLTDGWTFSMALIVAAGAYYVSHRNPPEIVPICVTNKGIKVGRHVLAYPSIKFFWIVYDPPYVKRLYIRLHARLGVNIAIELEDVDVNDLRKELKKHVAEHTISEEPFAETLIRWLRL